jgi:hypothetical protein
MIIIYGTVSSCHAILSGVPHSDSVHISTRWGATCVDCELSITRGTDDLYYFMQFSTPAVWNYLYSFPVTFLSYYVRSVDGRNHTVRLYYDNSAEGTVSDNSHSVVWERVNVSQNYDTMRIGNFHQNYCYQSNDRIDWGYWFVQVAADPSVSTSMAFTELSRMSFITNSPLPPDDKNQPRPCDDMTPALAVAWDLGVVSPGITLSRSLTLAYDQVYSIK